MTQLKLQKSLHKYLRFSSARRKYATMFILFALYYNLSAIAVPHRDDTDIIMPLNMVTLYD